MKKSRILTLISVIVFAAGVVVALLPLAARFGNTVESTRAITIYADSVDRLDAEQCTEMLKEAQQYNYDLSLRGVNFVLPDRIREQYNELLDPTRDGVMGYVEIPKIGVDLPIFHGTDEDVLSTSIGHLEWSSLPVGGQGTHSVLSGHNGLRGAQLLRDLNKLEKGDMFYIRVLEQTLAYKVDQILVVEPDRVQDLMIDENKDYCTLMTCTPYGRNTHRLLVRGQRAALPEDAPNMRLTADATEIEKSTVGFFITVPMLFILIITAAALYMSIGEGERNNGKKKYRKMHFGADDVPDLHVDCDTPGKSS